ncbi:hypothetical protein SALBM135S_07076 [Streptomyces alboniger]
MSGGSTHGSQAADGQDRGILGGCGKCHGFLERPAGEIYKELDKKILDNADWMPFLYEKNITWRGPRLTNAYMSDGYNGRYDYVSLGVVK